MKIQTKTTILFTVLTATIFFISHIAIYFFINAFAHRDFNKRLELRARLAAKYRFEQGKPSTQAVQQLQQEYLEELPEERATIFPWHGSGHPVDDSALKDLPASYLNRVSGANGNTVLYQKGSRHFAGLRYRDASGDYLVIASAANHYGNKMMNRLLLIKIAAFVVAVGLIFTVGTYFSRRTFQPIRDIISRVKQISKGNLHLRLRHREGGDEIAELTGTFNEMLNRLETAFEAQNNFISHASHELRTPLTAIIGEADYALSKERSPEAYRHSLQQIIQQAEKLQVLSRGLLSLAQTGFGGKAYVPETVRLDQLVFDVKDDCNAILPGNKVCVEMENMPVEAEGLSVTGNHALLKTAVNNVVLNACKYSNNQPVTLRLRVEGDRAVVTVKDRGIGIPAGELKYIYDPFFRASNTGRYEGYGIGMPLSNNIVRLHKGSIQVNSEAGRGTEVRISLPLNGWHS